MKQTVSDALLDIKGLVPRLYILMLKQNYKKRFLTCIEKLPFGHSNENLDSVACGMARPTQLCAHVMFTVTAPVNRLL